jgi:hypothetical protein
LSEQFENVTSELKISDTMVRCFKYINVYKFALEIVIIKPSNRGVKKLIMTTYIDNPDN